MRLIYCSGCESQLRKPYSRIEFAEALRQFRGDRNVREVADLIPIARVSWTRGEVGKTIHWDDYLVLKGLLDG